MPIITSNTTISAVFTPINTDSKQQLEFRAAEVKNPPYRESSAVSDTGQNNGLPNDLALPSTSRVEAPPALPALNDPGFSDPEITDRNSSPDVIVSISEQAQRARENAAREVPAQNRISDARLAAELASATGKAITEQPINAVMAQANSAPQQVIAALT